jgi:hypothetical protein
MHVFFGKSEGVVYHTYQSYICTRTCLGIWNQKTQQNYYSDETDDGHTMEIPSLIL